MGLGLQLHLQAVQLHSKLADLHAFSRFPDKLKPKATRHDNRSQVQFLNLGLPEEVTGGLTREGAPVQFSGGRRTFCSRRGVKKRSGLRNGGMRVVAALGELSRSGGLFWQPFWNNGENSGGDGLEFQGGGRDGGHGYSGGGGGGGGRGRGRGGDGSGGFDSAGEGLHESSLVEKGEKRDEEQGNGDGDVMSPGFRAPVLASLSSAAGDALDGEAPLGDLLLGRKKRVQESAAKVPSRASGKDTADEILREIDRPAHKYLNFLSPSNGIHHERSGNDSPLRKSECALCNVSSFFWSSDCDVRTHEVGTGRS